MALTNTSKLDHSAIAMVAQVLGENFNVTTDTALFTIPVGKEFTPFAVCISKISATLTTATITLGEAGSKTDFLDTQALTNITTAGGAIWLMPVPSATPAREIITYTAGEVFTLDHVVADAATADVSVFGFLNDA
jgi:hypothetical protein